ncbi:Guanylate cyclase soluble subunit alpha-2 [Bulinus truncatus]|nr:Guanylate cyclase soluble subunit alpha-2 [Bulinus truncatus]
MIHEFQKNTKSLLGTAGINTKSLIGTAGINTKSLLGTAGINTKSLRGTVGINTKSLLGTAGINTKSLLGTAGINTKSLLGTAGINTKSLLGTAGINTKSLLGTAGINTKSLLGTSGINTKSLLGTAGINTKSLLEPLNFYIRRAIQNVINSRNPRALENLRNESSQLFSEEFLQRSQSDPNLRHEAISDETLVAMAEETAKKLDMDVQDVLRTLGQDYFKLCLGDYGRALRTLGSNLLEFFSNIDGLQDQVKAYPRFQGQQPPSFRCEWKKETFSVHYYSLRYRILSFVAGTVEAVSQLLFNTKLEVSISCNRDTSAPHHIFYVTTAAAAAGSGGRDESAENGKGPVVYPDHTNLSTDPRDSRIGVRTFCVSFPFHFIFDSELKIIQLGASLSKMIAPEVASKGRHLTSYFDIVKPPVKASFYSILSRLNSSFVVRTKGLSKDNHRLSDNLELKGQMLFLQETDAILFLGSPSVEKLDEMIGKGIYISDIPIHDATRDVILVGEQTKAQSHPISPLLQSSFILLSPGTFKFVLRS